jgi:hypothetical protein
MEYIEYLTSSTSMIVLEESGKMAFISFNPIAGKGERLQSVVYRTECTTGER